MNQNGLVKPQPITKIKIGLWISVKNLNRVGTQSQRFHQELTYERSNRWVILLNLIDSSKNYSLAVVVQLFFALYISFFIYLSSDEQNTEIAENVEVFPYSGIGASDLNNNNQSNVSSLNVRYHVLFKTIFFFSK